MFQIIESMHKMGINNNNIEYKKTDESPRQGETPRLGAIYRDGSFKLETL